MLRNAAWMLFTAIIFVFVVPFSSAQDEKVIRAITPEMTEKLLQEMKVEFKKSSSKKGDEHYFDFARAGYKVRMTQFPTNELLLDCVFRGMPIEKVNMWNSVPRLSRASHHKDTSGDFTLLEYGLDLTGGVTTGAVKQFITRFEDELKRYEKFIAEHVTDDLILAEVSNEKLENLLKTSGINFTKKANKDGIMMFDFVLNEHHLRLYNFGGKDLMIDTHYKKLSLEAANRYNLNRKFVRVVNYQGKNPYTALESNFDCEAGVTEGMIRHWITSFGDDARHFGDYAKKLQAMEKK